MSVRVPICHAIHIDKHIVYLNIQISSMSCVITWFPNTLNVVLATEVIMKNFIIHNRLPFIVASNFNILVHD